MKTSLSHLPEHKQREITKILGIIKDEAKPEMVLLYGSHARGDWVEDVYVENKAIYSYISDYDFLVVIKKNGQKEYDIVSRIINRSGKFKNSVRPIVHDVDYVNHGLERGQYFFSDIIKEGVLIFDSKNYILAEARTLSQQEQKEEAEFYYDEWCESGIRLFHHTKLSFQSALQNGFKLNEIAFFLHQTIEKMYAGISLVCLGYKPKTHSIEEFRTYTKYVSEDLYKVFCYPTNDLHEKRLFEILQKSYIDARYKPGFIVSEQDLNELFAKVQILESIMIKICKDKIQSLT